MQTTTRRDYTLLESSAPQAYTCCVGMCAPEVSHATDAVHPRRLPRRGCTAPVRRPNPGAGVPDLGVRRPGGVHGEPRPHRGRGRVPAEKPRDRGGVGGCISSLRRRHLPGARSRGARRRVPLRLLLQAHRGRPRVRGHLQVLRRRPHLELCGPRGAGRPALHENRPILAGRGRHHLRGGVRLLVHDRQLGRLEERRRRGDVDARSRPPRDRMHERRRGRRRGTPRLHAGRRHRVALRRAGRRPRNVDRRLRNPIHPVGRRARHVPPLPSPRAARLRLSLGQLRRALRRKSVHLLPQPVQAG